VLAGLRVETAGDLQLMNTAGVLGIISPGTDRQAAFKRQQGHLKHVPARIIIQVLEDMEARLALLINFSHEMTTALPASGPPLTGMHIGQHYLIKTLHVDPVNGQGTGRENHGGQCCQHNELLFHYTHIHLCIFGELPKFKCRKGP
jgi:hypothetical protein